MKVTSFGQFKVGQRVRFETRREDGGEVPKWQVADGGLITELRNRPGDQQVRIKDGRERGSVEDRDTFGWSFDPGMNAGVRMLRDWYITHDEKGNPMSDTPKVGDEVEITQVWAGKVATIDHQHMHLAGVGYFRVDGVKSNGLKSVSVQVTKAAVVPWQEGDIVQVIEKTSTRKGEFRIRDAHGAWFDKNGVRQATDHSVDGDGDFYRVVMRGGKLV